MSSDHRVPDTSVPVISMSAENKDLSKGPIETVVLGDDDEDIICDNVIICDKSQRVSLNPKKAATSKSTPDEVVDVETGEDVTPNPTSEPAVSSQNVPETTPDCVEIMEVDKAPISEKPTSEVNPPDPSKSNGDCETTLSTDPAASKAPVESVKVPKRVVDLSDDNDDPIVLAGGTVSTARKSKGEKSNTCINFSCKSGEGLSKAPAFVLTHYGLKNKRNKQQEVCEECFELAVCHQEKVAGRLSANKCLLKTTFPLINDSVIVLDSDEEGSDVEEALLPEVLESIEKLLPNVIDETLKKFDVDFHVKEAQDYLSTKLTKMELEMEEMDKEIEETQKCLDEWRAEIYKPYQPVLKSSEPVEIIDVAPSAVNSPPSLAPIHSRKLASPLHSSAQAWHTKMSPDQDGGMQNSQQQQQTPQQKQQISQQYQLQQIQQHKQVQQQKLVQQQMQVKQQQQSNQSQQQKSQPGADDKRAVKRVSQGKGPQLKPESEVVALQDVAVTAPLPPVGTIRRPRPRVDDIVYVMKTTFFGAWATGRIMEVITKPDQSFLYKVRMDHSNRRAFSMKIVTGRHLAYPNPSPVLLTVGTRVISIFEDEETAADRSLSKDATRQENYYSGLIVEHPKSMNKYRYLVFFDDGYAQYVKHERILLVCECSKNIWEDIHPKSRDFIKNYLEQYPERPMVKLQPGQVVKTEWDGKWWIARVIQVDGSLVKMHFDADDRTEWIYRGSTRLAPLYAAQAQAQARAEGNISRMRGLGMATFKKPNAPYVEYTGTGEKEEERLSFAPAPVRAVAKKSTSKRTDITVQTSVVRAPPPALPEGHIQEIRLPVGVPLPKMFVPHQCGPSCIEWVHFDRDKMYACNPMSIPLLCGWQREVLKFRVKKAVMYTAPCGRRLRNMQELHRYLRLVGSTMTVDLFDFDSWVHALAEYALMHERNGKPFNIKIHDLDLSNGRERVPIPLVNYVDHTRPNPVEYSTTRQPTDGVPLQLHPDPEFLIGCDCTDDCQDKDKCSCWQLTLEGTALTPPGVVDPTVGYQYRRLPERVITGIYECNSRCKCSSTCLNRVVQHPLQLKLQLFKTPDKGWGIRCLNDIPQGTFICIYAGQLLTEQAANEEGAKYGDDYLAELDYIEVVERMKEGYESDVEDDFVDQENDEDDSKDTDRSLRENSNEDETSPAKNSKDSDDDYKYYYHKKIADSNTSDPIRSRLRKRTTEDDPMDGSKGKEDEEKRKRSSSKDKGSRRGSNEEGASVSDDDEFMRVPSSFTAQRMLLGGTGESKSKKLQSVRKSFGPKENVYIMDANHMGNIGRYLNHSCSPNVFVQNVFVDTHDLRFPWVAFFALTYIRAGNELTWDYSYDVGSVPDKQIQCRCGSAECRGRLI